MAETAFGSPVSKSIQNNNGFNEEPLDLSRKKKFAKR